MGASLTADGCRFRVWAPNASRVAVMGSFNAWRDDEYQLVRQDGDIWETEVAGVRAGDEYLYVIDNRGGDEWNPGQRGLRRVDPWARATRGSGGNAVVVDVDRELAESGLRDDRFVTPEASDWVIYQVHVGSFVGGGDLVDTGPTATGTFAQFEQKLGYVRSLGFNAIALLPIHENPGDGNEGYGPSHLFAPESSYGSPAQLRHLVRAAHDTGLAVVFDVVWNHMSDFDNRLWEFDGMTRDGGIFFEVAGRTPWGPRLAFWKREVRDLIVANAQMCFDEYHVDGLRVDAADELSASLLIDVLRAVRGGPDGRSSLMIAEWTGGDVGGSRRLINEIGFDRLWALGDPSIFLSAVNDDRVPDATERTDRLVDLITLPAGGARIRYLLGSHDTGHDNDSGRRTGFRHFVELAGGRDNWHARAKARIGWVLCTALPGTPMCFMGAECLQPGYWHPRSDDNPAHGDHRFNWQRCGDAFGGEMRALVGTANRVRWDHPALRSGSLDIVHVDGANGVVAFRRDAGGDAVLVVINVSDNSWPVGGYALPVPGDDRSWRKVLDSQDRAFGGDESASDEHPASIGGTLHLGVGRWSVMILRG
ncbi:MAG TPA: alpha-amylase family glycosyl hydrolase [Gemmatimonadales bacterium]